MRPLTAEGEAAWRELLTHLRWADGFSLILLFSAHPLTLDALRERVAEHYRVLVSRLDVYDWQRPEQLLDELLPRLITPSEHERALAAPCWVDLSQRPGEAWRGARAQLLLRLNERREALKLGQDRPLILVWPLDERVRVRELAPDLFAIREYTLALGDWTPREEVPQVRVEVQSPAPLPLDRAGELALAEWARVQHREERGALVASDRAAAALLAAWRIGEAEEVAQCGLRLARALVAQEETPEALRDLSLALENVGDALSAQGRWSEAGAVSGESLALRRGLLSRLGETPETLRDLSVSLERVGVMLSAQGRWSEAGEVYGESLALFRGLLSRLGETPQTLRDLSVVLERVGGVLSAQGRWSEAGEVYRESLALRRSLQFRLGETPETLRDLSVSLDKVGGVLSAQGRWSEAKEVYEESHALTCGLLSRLGETPQTLRDLAASIQNVGDVARHLGDLPAARRRYQEGLDLARLLARVLPDLPAYRDLPDFFTARLAALPKP